MNIQPKPFGYTIAKDYADIWVKNISITFWYSFECWQLQFSSHWGFSIGPIDVQWGD